MTVHLLDVNVLIALMWPAHESHDRAQEWFLKFFNTGWATCPLTQAGCVRILSNPSFSSDAVTPQEAIKILATNLKHPSHQFWPDDLSFTEAAQPTQKQIAGHQQITDAYLIGLVLQRKAKLATMDRGISTLLPKDKQSAVVLL